jgi:hypothetical protein
MTDLFRKVYVDKKPITELAYGPAKHVVLAVRIAGLFVIE